MPHFDTHQPAKSPAITERALVDDPPLHSSNPEAVAEALVRSIEDSAWWIRRRVLDMAASPQGAHVGGSLSSADVLAVLYGAVLRHDPARPGWQGRDRFVLSKGHASAALYAALAGAGYFDVTELATYGRAGSRLAGHPLRLVPGVEFPTGSLGHGLSLGTGLALAAKLGATGRHTFVLMGDGELQEGSVWEAAMCASHYRLDGLTAVVDRNRLQITGSTEGCIGLEPLADRWRSFGWEVREVDGHDVPELLACLSAHGDGRPCLIIAHTIKGAGVRFIEDKTSSHYATFSEEHHRRAVTTLRRGSELRGRSR